MGEKAGMNHFLKYFIYAAVFKVCFMPVYIAFCKSFDEFYAHGDCLLNMVKQTNPEHFEQMAYWSVLGFNDCPDLKWFYENKNKSFPAERAMLPFMMSATGLALLWCTFDLLRNNRSSILNWKIVPFFFFVRYAAMGFLLGWTHLEGDILYFLGNVSHHSDPAILGFGGQNNMIGVGDNGEKQHLFDGNFGAFWTTAIASYFLICYFANKYFDCNHQIAAIMTAVAVIGFVSKIGEYHADWHSNATPEWGKEIPMTYKWSGHHHVFGHHVHGFDIIQAWPHDKMFNPFLYFFSDLISKTYNGDIHSPLHVPFCFVFDCFFGIFMFVFLYAYANVVNLMMMPIDYVLSLCGLKSEKKLKTN